MCFYVLFKIAKYIVSHILFNAVKMSTTSTVDACMMMIVCQQKQLIYVLVLPSGLLSVTSKSRELCVGKVWEPNLDLCQGLGHC